MKAKSKSEIAYACGMSVSTLKRWMRRHSEKFEEMGVTPTQRLLPPQGGEVHLRGAGHTRG